MTKDSSLDNLISTIYNTILPLLLTISSKKSFFKSSQIVIRCVEQEEMMQLNTEYRDKKGVTNVLSFPDTLPTEVSTSLGDIVICPNIVKQEAVAQHKIFSHHFTHIMLHGILHLFGYDHIAKDDATEMQRLEISLLKVLGIQDPYE